VLNIPDWLQKLFIFLLFLYRRLRFGYPFRRIPLSLGKFAIVDPEDYERINKHKWFVNKNKYNSYARRNVWKGRNREVVRMHREILNAPAGLLVDHINHNGLDNRKANLRLATRTQNSWNRRKPKIPNCTSRFKGVGWHKGNKKWSTKICFNGKRKTIGYFADEIEAAKAYDKAAKKYHKEFALLNFPKQ